MKTLFVYGALQVEKANNIYHHNFLGSILERYKQFGELTVCSVCKECENSMEAVVNLDIESFYPLVKENTIKTRFLDRRHNKQVLKSLVKSHDFIIIHVPSSSSELAAKLALKYRKPYLAIVVGCPWDALWNYNLKGKLLAPLAYCNMKRYVKRAPYALYVTNFFLQNRYPNYNYSLGCSDVCIKKNDFSVCTIRKDRMRELTKNDEIKLVTVAAVNAPFKGQRYVIKAISQLNNWGWKFHYYLIGGGDNSFLKSIIQKYNMEEYVHFLGQKSHEDVIKELEMMDIYIQPSKQEGLPRALVEAMSLGMPAIGSNIAGIPELLGSDYLFKIGNIKEIITLLQSPKEKWIQAIDENYIKAQNYLPDILDEKRDKFFDYIKRDYITFGKK